MEEKNLPDQIVYSDIFTAKVKRRRQLQKSGRLMGSFCLIKGRV